MILIDILKQHKKLNLTPFFSELEKLISEQKELFANPKGNSLKYSLALNNLPSIEPLFCQLDSDTVSIKSEVSISDKTAIKLKSNLMELGPWRKGPFDLFGVKIDSEWQSWIKWNRFIDKIEPLKNRKILDIGSSNGYYMFRMAAHNPKMVLGVEPQQAFYFQYLALQKYLNIENIFCFPIPFDALPNLTNYFNTVFCMGVIYHRRSPLDMLKKINEMMRAGGELIIETLIIESDEHICLSPVDRYAKMRNIFFIPTVKVMESWLRKVGFCNIKTLDISTTDHQEQRKTEWIETESLTDFLDSKNPSKTVEGYPAPVRAIFSARAI
ncbi:MAG: tRNA 5-methoxyuridine(34)/uridine 5-oxyacetic acid(34) synthase CmoB [Desulfamplus sp.]|nr:tRNA 5-methoxyuridine(34)/uridine 5-oxyacetic acid(34) synthase CmoB [Desulfamplus sp.]